MGTGGGLRNTRVWRILVMYPIALLLAAYKLVVDDDKLGGKKLRTRKYLTGSASDNYWKPLGRNEGRCEVY